MMTTTTMSNNYKHTALVDCDYVLYIACNGNKVYNKGEAVREDGKFVYTDKTEEQAINTCDSYLTDMLHNSRADSYILCLSASKSFRHQVDPNYKANRSELVKPLWYNEVKNHLREHWGAFDVPGLEADDVVSLTYKLLNNCFIVSTDKDLLDCIAGTHFDARKGRSCFITTTESQAEFNFAKSLLTGDTVDNIPNIKKGYGPKTAEKDLLKSDIGLIDTVKALYVQEYGDEGLVRYEKQYKLLKMIDSLSELPEGINYEIPEPSCYNCIQNVFSSEEYKLDYD